MSLSHILTVKKESVGGVTAIGMASQNTAARLDKEVTNTRAQVSAVGNSSNTQMLAIMRKMDMQAQVLGAQGASAQQTVATLLQRITTLEQQISRVAASSQQSVARVAQDIQQVAAQINDVAASSQQAAVQVSQTVAQVSGAVSSLGATTQAELARLSAAHASNSEQISAVASSSLSGLSGVAKTVGDLLCCDFVMDTADAETAEETISAAELNAAATGTFKRTINVNFETAAGAIWYGANFGPVVVSSAEHVTDEHVTGLPFTPEVPEFSRGHCAIEVTFMTDEGSDMVYADGDYLTVTFKSRADGQWHGKPVADFVKTFTVIA
jgi:hypothetical protein